MASRTSLDWGGDRLAARILDAAREAVNETVDAARDDAKATHPWKNDPRVRTHKGSGRKFDSHLEHEIKSEHADPADPNPAGRFGYTRRKGFYGAFHEFGTKHEHEYPTIRPAADREFPTFVERIRARL